MKNNQNDFTNGNIKKQLFFNTIPMIFGMLGLVIFNLADTYFISKLGTQYLAALSFTFPVVLIINSIAVGIGIGVGAVVSKNVGMNNMKAVRRVSFDSFLLGFILILILVVIGLFTIRPLFSFLGAKGSVLYFIERYMQIWYWGVLSVVFPMIANNIMRALGNSKLPGILMSCSALLNIILDPLLIFGIGVFPKMGIEGAAISTVIARTLSAIISVYVIIKREHILKLKNKFSKMIIDSWKKVLYIGLPNALIKLILPVLAAIITKIIASNGDYAVAAFGVGSKIEFFSMMMISALASITGPFVGQNLGALKFDRVKKTIKISNLYAILISLSLAIVFVIFADFIANIFSDEFRVINTVKLYLYIVPFSFIFQGMLKIETSILNILDKPILGSAIVLLHVFIINVPAAYLGNHFFGIKGIFFSLLFSYIFSGIMSYKVLLKELVKYKKKYKKS